MIFVFVPKPQLVAKGFIVKRDGWRVSKTWVKNEKFPILKVRKVKSDG